ncbi:hypothetical protein GCM10022222_28360 [Amycolatopsis ultiminotia]|uniref:Major facilitator superfamily (MFS) profile domain-containing protein n=1 Tax=Amycolatopsis ultiminotia TaxID=543629 RepID=A0ABP6W104_9PSEU
MVDGFDILVLSFAASGVAGQWTLTGSETGLPLSSGPAGMAVGSASVAPLADRIGRRPLTVACLELSTVGMVTRLPVLLAEYSPRRKRGTVIARYSMGLPLGGVLGGAIAALPAAEFGWRGRFVAGAVITALMLLWLAFLAMMAGFCFASSWMPRLPEQQRALGAAGPQRWGAAQPRGSGCHPGLQSACPDHLQPCADAVRISRRRRGRPLRPDPDPW